VRPDLTVPGHPDIFVIGDLARCADRDGAPLPGIAPVAMQQGRYVGRVIGKRLRGDDAAPFRYVNKGELATIGRAAAVANFGRLRFSGYPAWLLWLFVHLMYLVDFENRLLVFVQWAWNYVTWNRGARLIAHAGRRGDLPTGGSPPHSS
jgi:NADH dehydrogenase